MKKGKKRERKTRGYINIKTSECLEECYKGKRREIERGGVEKETERRKERQKYLDPPKQQSRKMNT